MRQRMMVMFLTAFLATASTARAADPEGQKVFNETCTSCHGPGQHPLDEVRLSRPQWKEAVERMEGLGADIPKGKKLDALLDWLAESHGPPSGGAASEKK